MSSEFKKIKSFHIIDIKYKTKYKRFISSSNNFIAQTNFVTFKGAEIEKEAEFDNLEDVKALIAKTEVIERYYPWTSVVEIKVKRYKEDI